MALNLNAPTSDITLYEVGGCVRDVLLGLKPHDWDYSVEVTFPFNVKLHAPDHVVSLAFDAMRDYLTRHGFEIFVESPEYATIRARFPREGRDRSLPARTADFVLCRKDGPSSDGRRPDYVEVGTLSDDLRRRDFSVNALARHTYEVDGQWFTGDAIYDNHGGLLDLEARRIRFVGDPMDRLQEDGLRALRAIRFKITKGFEFHQSVRDALKDPETATLLAGTSVERRREELEKCFHHDTIGTMDLLMNDISEELRTAIFSGSLRLAATQKRDRVRQNGER